MNPEDVHYTEKREIEAAARDLADAINKGNSDLVTEKEFAYSSLLVHSRSSLDIHKGIQNLKELSNIPTCKKDAVYLIALGYYRLQKPDEAMFYVDHALDVDPENERMRQFRCQINQMKDKQRLLTQGIIGGAAALVFGGVGLIGWSIYMATRRR
ncbi:Mitochondrial fission 1 protein [Thelohanellus kitauei]|uniref:Mitochondrial fission 1 protein n=1 Tax=Thelohanellus kitauei TaxID=669202 RepID=A0A0C2JDE1_THEKT|nr:Mitochondrial fission 1 protein [Thelohanellus kitauei]